MVVKASDLQKELLSDLDRILPEVEKVIDQQLREKFLEQRHDGSPSLVYSVNLTELVSNLNPDQMTALQDELVRMYSTDEQGNPQWDIEITQTWLDFWTPSG